MKEPMFTDTPSLTSTAHSGTLSRMKTLMALCLFVASIAPAATLKSEPPMPYRVVADWAKLPQGWSFGACSTVTVDQQDHVWIFSRGAHPVTEFDRDGKMLRAWGEGAIQQAHGIRIDGQGNVWGVDVTGQVVRKYTPEGRVLMVVGQVGKTGDNDSRDAFNRPTNVAFAPNGDFYVSDGYVNSRVVRFSKDGKYIGQWGHKGAGDGEFDLVHDIVLDKRNRLLVAERTNQRIQIFDLQGKLLGKWTYIGAPWSLFYVAREDAVYMADGVNMRVVKLNMEGGVVGVLGGPGKAPGQFDAPHGIAVDSAGAIYVAEVGNQRVQKFVKSEDAAPAAASPYPPPASAAADLRQARERARRSGKLLMVVFGGNWCADCRALHDRLRESPVREYAEERFEVVNVNIGEMDANLGIVKDLGVSLEKGVPAAAFFASDGKPVGITNQGELEPARQYSAQQVLTFLRRVAEQHVIEKPR